MHFWRRYIDVLSQSLNRHVAQEIAFDLEASLTPPIDAHHVLEELRRLESVNPNIEVFLLDADGTVLLARGRISQKKVDVRIIEQFLKQSDTIGDILRNVHPTTHSRDTNSKVVFSAAPITIRDKPGYVYVVLRSMDYVHISERLGDIRFQIAAIINLVLIFVLGTVLGLFLIRYVTRRFYRVTEGVSRFSAGDYTHRITVDSNDEVGELAGTFNEMAQKLHEYIQQLQENDQRRRALVANVSHDLRTPLSSIKGFLQMLQLKHTEALPEEGKSFLERAEHNTLQLELMVHELFQLAKLEAREAEPAYEEFALDELADEVLQRFMPKAVEAGVELLLDVPDPITKAFADPMLIDRALGNLIDNALRYTPQGGTVTVSLLSSTDGINVAVRDTGSGIPQEDLPHLFERFYRVEQDPHIEGSGSGLGLAIVKRIIELHNTEIYAVSELGTGTVFTFKLQASATTFSHR